MSSEYRESTKEDEVAMTEKDLFTEFIGHEVKVPYRDGAQFKIARGILEDINSGFIKVTGKLGTIVINQKNIERISKINSHNLNPS